MWSWINRSDKWLGGKKRKTSVWWWCSDIKAVLCRSSCAVFSRCVWEPRPRTSSTWWKSRVSPTMEKRPKCPWSSWNRPSCPPWVKTRWTACGGLRVWGTGTFIPSDIQSVRYCHIWTNTNECLKASKLFQKPTGKSIYTAPLLLNSPFCPHRFVVFSFCRSDEFRRIWDHASRYLPPPVWLRTSSHQRAAFCQ